MLRMQMLAICCLLITQTIQAGEMDACYQANFTQIDRIADLPPEVIGLVYANTLGEPNLSSWSKEEQEKIQARKYYLGIADRGGSFSPGCTPIGDQASQRLIMAAVSPECVLVAIEHGGAGHGAGLRVFLRENDAWVRGDKFEHPSAYLSYQGKYDTDLQTFITQANYELGRAFEYGQGVKKDPAELIRWYTLAANQGHAKSMYTLGEMYSEGRGTSIDLTTALQWFEKAAEKNVHYQYKLGAIYLRSRIARPDTKKGVKLIRAAAEAGDGYAQAHLGQLYLEGDYLKQDYAKALKLFRDNISDTGNGARYYLGIMYKSGLGVKKNLIAAWALLIGSGRNPQFNDFDFDFDFIGSFSQDDWQEAKNLKMEMDGGFTQGKEYIQSKGALKALDAYLAQKQ